MIKGREDEVEVGACGWAIPLLNSEETSLARGTGTVLLAAGGGMTRLCGETGVMGL